MVAISNKTLGQPEPFEALNKSPKQSDCSPLQALTTAALVLPGLVSPMAYAAEGDEVDFQYSHYQEGKRDISSVISDPQTGDNNVSGIKNGLNPIEVETLHGSAKVTLTDRIKFAFNYTQDTWGGATPISTAPALFAGNREIVSADGNTVVGASAYLKSGVGQIFLDGNLNPVQTVFPGDSSSGFIKSNQLSHTLASASPETRKQGDFKLTYEWDEAALSVGGGISIEDDYESRFGNIGGRWDLNQKRTTLNLDLSYTNSDTNAVLDHDAFTYIDSRHYALNGQLETLRESPGSSILSGNRQDWASHFGITQVLTRTPWSGRMSVIPAVPAIWPILIRR